jgi:hypothetical protein
MTLEKATAILEEIDRTISRYDATLREKARDILLVEAFGLEPIVKAADSVCEWHHQPHIRLRDLMDLWHPLTQVDQTLLCAYHLQHVLGYSPISGRQIQKALGDCGLHLTNVTVSANKNLSVVPPRLEIVRVSSSKHRYYRVTSAGVRFVDNHLRGFER